MTDSVRAPPPFVRTNLRPRVELWLGSETALPVALFVCLSLAFGSALVVLTPPFRNADEPAHFLRAYGIAQGEIVPSERAEGRLGIQLPADLHADYSFFEDARYRFAEAATRYGETFAAYRDRKPIEAGGGTVFVPYQGSEAYSPAAYLPYAAVAATGRLAGADFLPLIYAMRIAGLLLWTGLAAAAIALAPAIAWPLVLIALLPSALQGRAAVSADGAALSLAMLVTALALRAAPRGSPAGGEKQRASWMTLCLLVKPSQLALAPIALLTHRKVRGQLWRGAAVALPGVLLTGLWVWLIGGEMAAWRLTDAGYAAEQFEIGWKLGFMAEHPAHFPRLLAASLWTQMPELYRQFIGVLGWLDTPLRGWSYPVLGLALLTALVQRLEWSADARSWAIGVAAATAAGYVAFVYFLLYVTWTPVAETEIWGVQGRYFLPALPVLAVGVAAASPWRSPAWLSATAAGGGGVLAGLAAIDAVWHANW